jgi:hypothetical protein
LFFIPNSGQAPSRAGFLAKGSGLNASFTPDGVSFRMGETSVRMEFEGANPRRRLEGGERLPGRVNFLRGDPTEWRTGIPTYGSVVYRELYPGIDMVYGSNGRNLKSEFLVRAGADPARIRIRYSGADFVRVGPDGALVITVDGQELQEQEPAAYQERGGGRIAIPAQFSVDRDGSVSFLVGSTIPNSRW